MKKKPEFMNFAVDHMTLLLHPQLYRVAYPIFRIIFGSTPEDILYEKRRAASATQKETSMTFATRIGESQSTENVKLSTIIAVVQPSEPKNESSHVREMLDSHNQAAHWQHIALRTTDLIAFHKHAMERGVQFVTPILKDEHENLIQVFSGEWYFPGIRSSALFFEFLQREPSEAAIEQIQKANKQTWFRDETFMGLYHEKEREYQSGKVIPFLPEGLFLQISEFVGEKQVWEITEDHLATIEKMMLDFPKK